MVLIADGFIGDGKVEAAEIEGGVEKAQISPVEAASRAETFWIGLGVSRPGAWNGGGIGNVAGVGDYIWFRRTHWLSFLSSA